MAEGKDVRADNHDMDTHRNEVTVMLNIVIQIISLMDFTLAPENLSQQAIDGPTLSSLEHGMRENLFTQEEPVVEINPP